MQTKSTTLEKAITQLVNKYPVGIPSPGRYCYGFSRVPARLLNHTEVQILLNASNNNFEKFKQLISASPNGAACLQEQINSLLTNWFIKLKQSDNYRIKLAQTETKKLELKQKRALELKIRTAELAEKRKQEQQKLIEKRKKEAEKLKRKAKRKSEIWKQLSLSDKQKKLLRQVLS